MPIKAIKTDEPVLGYTLKERIGSGGYGEVWSAEAPGGFAKAIKFIYGYHDENRAQRELKALNRVKEVRHPFLLSLERIDIVDGQMVVITELADMSLKDRFDLCVDSGLKGIPRVELLGYLRDAADALDFISEEHRLQHLDIKPENLLLVSGHVKVADYGLVKDIHDGTQSMMGGLTPAFAPPELFDGRPSKASDQYSLAIVFQEMLTGRRPFEGTTAAQLASQHMNERPQLNGLPREDQGIISRALSKDPELRFPNCRTLVNELSNRAAERGKTRKTTPKKIGKTGGARQVPHTTVRPHEGTQPLTMRPAKINKLPPVDCDAADAKVRPTLFLGLGHTGTHILRRLRRRLRDRVGSGAAAPSISLLCLDTDRRDLATACRGESTDTLDDHETFALPLRRPEEYRADAKMHLSWLSRRWIYNVPRSLQTEGVRPLGRLAFADHHEQLFVRLRHVLSDITRPEALAETATTLNMDPLEHPRIYIVGSISGGTCSGMAIDVAYAVRAIMQELDVDDDDVIGLFAHSTGRCITDRELTVANSLAFLNELYHYSCVADFPGDETCHLPEFEDDGPTFGSTYLVHLGDNLIQKEYDAITDSIAEYLYLSALTPCAAFFDACRAEEPADNGLPVRTLGVSRSGNLSGIVGRSARLLCQRVLKAWLNEVLDKQFDVQLFAHEHLAAQHLTNEDLVQRIHEQILASHPDPVSALAQQMLRAYDAGDRSQNLDRVRQVADQFFGMGTEGNQASLHDMIGQLGEQLRKEVQESFSQGILALVDEPQLRYGGAHAARQAICERLREYQNKVEKLKENTADQMRHREERMEANEPLEDVATFIRDYAQLHLQLFTISSVLRLFATLTPILDKAGAGLNEVQARLASVAEGYASEQLEQLADDTGVDGEEDSAEPVFKLASRMAEHLNQRLEKLVARADRYFHHTALEANGGFRSVLENGSLFGHLLEEATRLTVVEELRETNLDQFLDSSDACREIVQWLTLNAQPRLLCCGGGSRLLVAIPERRKSSVISQEFQNQLEHVPCVIPATAGEFVACYEVEQVPVNNITFNLLQNQPDSIEFASRLHTRTDVAWSPLTAIR